MAILVKQISGPWQALGLAAHFIAKRGTFGRFPSGDLIRTLSGQIHRGHYFFALDDATEPARVVGYFGWALYDNAVADRFAATGAPPVDGLASGGDVVWVLTAAAETREAFFALIKAGRALYPAHRVMGIRHKRDGRKVMFDRLRPAGRTAQRRASEQFARQAVA